MKPQYYQKQESGTKTRDRSLLYPHTTTLMANKKQKLESKKHKNPHQKKKTRRMACNPTLGLILHALPDIFIFNILETYVYN